MFGLSTESETVSGDGSSSPDDSAPGLVIDVHAIEDDDDNSVDDASSKLLSEYLSTHRRPVSTTKGVMSRVSSRTSVLRPTAGGAVGERVRASTGDRTVDGPSPTSVNTFLFGTLAIPFTPLCQCLSDETVKAVGPFYLVSMSGEV